MTTSQTFQLVNFERKHVEEFSYKVSGRNHQIVFHRHYIASLVLFCLQCSLHIYLKDTQSKQEECSGLASGKEP